MSFSKEQTKLLSDKLDPKHVIKPTGQYGPKGDYVEGWHVIDEANRIFGFDGWSYRIVETAACHEPLKNEKGNWSVSWLARVEVTAGGVTREDIGYGSGHSKQIGDAYEGATKEAVTDALKRALRTFGNAFGLALYDKSRANVGVDAPPEKPNEQPKQVSAAEMKRGLATIDQELVDCRTVNDVNKLAAFWKEISGVQLWSKDYSLQASKKFAAQRTAILDAEANPEDIFPGDTPLTDDEVRQHPLNA